MHRSQQGSGRDSVGAASKEPVSLEGVHFRSLLLRATQGYVPGGIRGARNEVRMKRSRPGFKFEVEVLRGDEGRELRLEQAQPSGNSSLGCEHNAATSPANPIIGP